MRSKRGWNVTKLSDTGPKRGKGKGLYISAINLSIKK